MIGAVNRLVFAPVALIGGIHIANGLAVLLAPKTLSASGLAGLGIITAPIAAPLLITVGALAIIARVWPMKLRYSLLLILPQQIVLLVQLLGVVVALKLGHYPDGYVPGGTYWDAFWFIFGDQAAIIFLCISHTLDMGLAPILNARLEKLHWENSYMMEMLEWYRTKERGWPIPPPDQSPQPEDTSSSL